MTFIIYLDQVEWKRGCKYENECMNVWMLIFVIIFMLHNLEEIISVEKWFQKTYPRVRNRIPSLIQQQLDQIGMTTVRFAVVVFVISILASILLLISVWTEQYYFFFGISFFFALNIFTHPLQSLLLRCYTPGLLTTVVLIIPYYGLFFFNFTILNY